MKIANSFIVSFLCFLTHVSCSAPATETQIDPPETGSKEEPVVPPAPGMAELVFPENNTECNEGEIVDDIYSLVTFRWSPSENTDSYYLDIENLERRNHIPVYTTRTEATVELRRDTAYKWYVVSASEISEETNTSPVWQFYNAGPGEVNHSPFPATLVYPATGEVLEYADDPIYLEWTGADLDNDILSYEIFFGTDPIPNISLAVVTDTRHSFPYDYQKGSEYFWQIKTTDQKGHASWSEVFNFIVN